MIGAVGSVVDLQRYLQHIEGKAKSTVSAFLVLPLKLCL